MKYSQQPDQNEKKKNKNPDSTTIFDICMIYSIIMELMVMVAFIFTV